MESHPTKTYMDAPTPNFRLVTRPVIRARSPRELLICSLDDTLIETSLYWLARKAFVQAGGGAVSQSNYEAVAGLDGGTIRGTLQAFRKICGLPEHGDTDLDLKIIQLLRSKFPTALPGAEDFLKWAQPRFTLVLSAEGDSAIQLQKLEAAKFAGFFKKTRIVAAKRKDDYLALMTEMGFSPRNTWVLGASVRTDIDPAADAGANCVFLESTNPRPETEKLEEPSGGVFRICDLPDARAILSRPGEEPVAAKPAPAAPAPAAPPPAPQAVRPSSPFRLATDDPGKKG
jgi:FMN phosphatase YigB (HAD superfamily)